MGDDYALFISLALYGVYAVAMARQPREERTMARTTIALLAAVAFYTLLKYAFVRYGIQPD